VQQLTGARSFAFLAHKRTVKFAGRMHPARCAGPHAYFGYRTIGALNANDRPIILPASS
jgi:hypothetical protein